LHKKQKRAGGEVTFAASLPLHPEIGVLLSVTVYATAQFK